jgi:hypothetical protein
MMGRDGVKKLSRNLPLPAAEQPRAAAIPEKRVPKIHRHIEKTTGNGTGAWSQNGLGRQFLTVLALF